MRFIRSARHKEEQNLCAIQHGENIFYRTLVNIPVGAELLVWYEEKYDEYLGIPIALHNDYHKSSQPGMNLVLCLFHFTTQSGLTSALANGVHRLILGSMRDKVIGEN